MTVHTAIVNTLFKASIGSGEMKRKKKMDFNFEISASSYFAATEKLWFNPLRINPFDLKSFRTPRQLEHVFQEELNSKRLY